MSGAGAAATRPTAAPAVPTYGPLKGSRPSLVPSNSSRRYPTLVPAPRPSVKPVSKGNGFFLVAVPGGRPMKLTQFFENGPPPAEVKRVAPPNWFAASALVISMSFQSPGIVALNHWPLTAPLEAPPAQ